MNKINKNIYKKDFNKNSNYLNYNNYILNKKRNKSVQLYNNNSNNIFFNMNSTKNYNITNYLKNKKKFFSCENKTKRIKSERTKSKLFQSLFNINEELNKKIDNKTKLKINMNFLKDFQNTNSNISNNNISSDSLSNRYSNINSNRYSHRNKISYINYFYSKSKRSYSFETFEKNTIENENMNKKNIYHIIIKNRNNYIDNFNYYNDINKNNFFILNHNKSNFNSKINKLNGNVNNIKIYSSVYSSQNNFINNNNKKININNSYDNIFEINDIQNKSKKNFNKKNYFSIDKNIKDNINKNNNKNWSIINDLLSTVKRKNYIKNLKLFDKENKINYENFNNFINKPINNIPLIFKELCIKITGNKNITNFEEINIKELLNYYAKKLYLKIFFNNLINIVDCNKKNNNFLIDSNYKINEELKLENYNLNLNFNNKLLKDINLLNKRKNIILNKYKEDLEYFKEVNKFISKIK